MSSRQSVSEFRQENERNFEISELAVDVKASIFTECKIYLSDCEKTSRVDHLACLRILSRDPDYQIQLTEPPLLAILTREADLLDGWSSPDEAGIVEAMKCLSNILFKTPSCSVYLRTNGCIDSLVDRCEQQVLSLDQSPIKLTIMNFDLKILFLISALDTQARLELLNRYFASDVFVDLLAWCIRSLHATPVMIDITIELLKFLFNLGYAKKELDYKQKTYEVTYTSLTVLIRSLLIESSNLQEKRFELISHSVNFLTSVPHSCYSLLLSPRTATNGDSSSATTECSSNLEPYTDPDTVQALSVLLAFLDHQLTTVDSEISKSSNSTELLTPILNVIESASKANRTIRKYFRYKILPPLGAEVKELPESGNTLRNRLCQRLTACKSSDEVVESVALVIFVLCKERISRAIKYSGFGNFAGFMARHGLLRPRSDTRDTECYSDTSSNSDTEEYRQLKDQVHPVTGRVEAPKPDPMWGMSEEQKEYEAMELVKKIDRLQRSGLIKPGTISEDGGVRPVEHVLELINQSTGISDSNEESSDDE